LASLDDAVDGQESVFQVLKDSPDAPDLDT
jgi:hypothetical protein